ncbi:Flavin reductase like domain containing protein [Amanita muscaria]
MSKTIRTAARCFHHVTACRKYSTAPHEAIKRDLRVFLRDTAQPVAVVTSFMPNNENEISSSAVRYHGATLSSFTSIAMDPYPLVAFALRIPSRMATSLKAAQADQPSHMVINLLSAEQSSVAVTFSRPDLHPFPFATVPYTLTKEGLPVIQGSLGALSCKLVRTALPLNDLNYLEQKVQQIVPHTLLGDGKECAASELFIARVARVEIELDTGDGKLPLLYYRRGYATVSPIPQLTYQNQEK